LRHYLEEKLPFDDRRFPLLLQPATGASPDLAAVVEDHRYELEAKLFKHGAILLRGFDLRDVEGFDRAVDAVSKDRSLYVYRSTPRSALGNSIYTATEYPAEREIPLHNENAYQRIWPLKVAFACLKAAASGGETPLADMQRVSARIGSDLLDMFESRGVRYIRHYHPYLDLSWQTVFQTDSRENVAEFCKVNDITYEWTDHNTLRTEQVCQGTSRHPISKERVFFNQAHLFHVSSLGAEDAAEMIELYGLGRLPRHACYGDGQEIEPRVLQIISDAFRSETRSLAWQAGDFMLIDNMQIAHGRRPFTGERTVLAALLQSYSEPSK
jgi:alpha-ketoglutarate-dependent taurine dioxygenase